ncbi:MAG: DUF5615 family PIN-like protein [Hormoscilla sp. GUM202]|nr:DUF5615 family PIN-like protein [Hormoscilla sp. GUM202]
MSTRGGASRTRSQAKRLVELLRDAGQDVITVREADLMTKPDSLVLDYARQVMRKTYQSLKS